MKIYLIISLLFSAIALQAKSVQLIQEGKTSDDLRLVGDSWKAVGNDLQGQGLGQRLEFKHQVSGDAFRITLKLAIENPGNTAAGLFLGDAFFGFDGRNGYFTEGGTFGATQFHEGPKIKAGEYFNVEVQMQRGKLTFKVDGSKILARPFEREWLYGIALRPHRAKLKIREFRLEGKFQPLKPLNHLFTCGDEGYKSYRIPAIVTTPKGTLLAFCEGRKNSSHDHGDIDVVMKRSEDGGQTWSALRLVHDNGKTVAGNPVPIIDYKTGQIHLISCTSDHHEGAIYEGKGRRGIVIQHSDDDGKSWSPPRDISKSIYPDNWRWYATGPCSGIQIREGRHAGRLICPANHTIVESSGGNKNEFRAHCLYSDDHGKTWKLGASSTAGGNESSIAEVSKDLLIQSIRMQSHRKGRRGIRYSSDGGETWNELQHEAALPCPKCQGAVTRDYRRRGLLIHSNPGTSQGRKAMTLRLSNDGGKTWPKSKLIHPSSSAYSDTCFTQDGQIGLLFEAGHSAYWQEGIVFEIHSPASLH